MRTVMTAYLAPGRGVRRARQMLGRQWVTLEVVTGRAVVRLLCTRWLGYFVCGWQRNALVVPEWVQGFNIDEVKAMKKPQVLPSAIAATAQATSQTVVFEPFPNLMEHMTCRLFDDGSPRNTAMLMLSVAGSMWRATLKDRNADLQLNLLGATADDALMALELALGAEQTPWEPDAWAASKAPKKSKK